MNTDKHGSEIEQLRKENQRLQQDRDAAIRQLADEGRTRGAVELERDRLRDENRRLREAALTVMDRIRRAGAEGWSMEQFLNDGSARELVEALAQPAPAPAEAQQPEPASDGGLLDYPEAARVIALWLKDFCDEGKTYPDMIADAARKAGEEIGRLRKISGDYRKAVELITRRPRIGKSAEDCWAQDGTVSMNVRHLISDLEDMHQRWQQAIAASKGEVQHG